MSEILRLPLLLGAVRLVERFGFRLELCRIPSIIKLVKLMPFSSLVGLPMFTVRFVRYFGYPC